MDVQQELLFCSVFGSFLFFLLKLDSCYWTVLAAIQKSRHIGPLKDEEHNYYWVVKLWHSLGAHWGLQAATSICMNPLERIPPGWNFTWACLISRRSAKSVIDVCVALSFSYQEMGAVFFCYGKCTNISQINILFNAWGYLLWEINQSLSEALNKPLEQTSPQRIKNPSSVPPWPLISSDSNQATDSSVIIIHVVNHLLLQKNCFPCCPTLLCSQTQMLRSNNGGWDCHCCGGIIVTVNTIFCNFRLINICFLVSCSGKWHIYFIQQ